MTFRKTLAHGLALGLIATSTMTHAASLGGMQGEVLLNKGDGFKTVTTGASLSPSDRIMVKPGSQAVIKKACGIVPVAPGLMTVGPEDKCQSVETQGLTNGISPVVIIAGGVGAIVGIAAAAGAFKKDKCSSGC